jgi:enoyl-CoA hydratase/carnithine racemase
MASLKLVEAYVAYHGEAIERVARARKPIVAAVAGYCPGGGPNWH